MEGEELDYEGLGFMCGIEIHQQLDTHKLFCNCPSIIRDEEPHVRVNRKMRAVAGEMGDVDPAALHEFLRDRSLVYEAYVDTNCLVELDEEPPHPLNQQALDTCLKVCLLLEANPVREVHVMRKTVIDGSNTSGFQRTMLVGEDGRITTSQGVVGIPSICLEEDAARIISEKDGVVNYRLDRLGIPLVEIATTPDIKNPRHAREVAEKLGSILRATDVKRGLGTIRQDINVSIRDGTRIEIKGVQDLRLIPKVVEGEVRRQVMLLEAKKELGERGVAEADFDADIVDLTGVFKRSQSKVITMGLEKGGGVLGVRLIGCDGLLKGNLGPQIAQYARALAGVKGLFHGDELPAYGISPQEVFEAKGVLKLGEDDSFAIVCAEQETARKALQAALDRLKTAVDGVPVEVRRAKDDGSTEYMRPLPGSKRMYPETDEPLVRVSGEKLGILGEDLPELREDKARRYEGLGLGKELADQISKGGMDQLFEQVHKAHPGVDATVVATTLTSYTKEAVKRYGIQEGTLSKDHYLQIIGLYSKGGIGKDALVEVIRHVGENPSKKVEDVVGDYDLGLYSDEKLKKVVGEVARAELDLIKRLGDKAVGPLTGKVMAKAKGKADAGRVQKLIRELI